MGLYPKVHSPFHILLFISFPQAFYVCLPEVNNIDVGLVNRLHISLSRVDTQQGGTIDSCHSHPLWERESITS